MCFWSKCSSDMCRKKSKIYNSKMYGIKFLEGISIFILVCAPKGKFLKMFAIVHGAIQKNCGSWELSSRELEWPTHKPELNSFLHVGYVRVIETSDATFTWGGKDGKANLEHINMVAGQLPLNAAPAIL